MKKNNLLTATALVASLVLLGACSGKKATTQASSSTNKASSTTTSSTVSASSSSSTPSIQTGMDINAILAKDFSSVKGTWQSWSGHILMFDKNGLVSDASILSNAAEIKDGMLQTGINSVAGPGYALVMVPAGVAIPDAYFYDGSDPSDITRDRMYGAQNILSVTNFAPLYKVSDISSLDGWLTYDSGAVLESGPVTIEYANNHLGDRAWTVIEDNYNRTESTPFGLVQGNDGSLYRIYRNGVIVTIDSQLVYVPA